MKFESKLFKHEVIKSIGGFCTTITTTLFCKSGKVKEDIDIQKVETMETKRMQKLREEVFKMTSTIISSQEPSHLDGIVSIACLVSV